MVGIIMFFAALLMLLIGFPVAFTFGAVSVLFGLAYGLVQAIQDGGPIWEGFMSYGVDMFGFMPFRIYSIMQNTILMAVPLFILMGIILQKTKLAERLFFISHFLTPFTLLSLLPSSSLKKKKKINLFLFIISY